MRREIDPYRHVRKTNPRTAYKLHRQKSRTTFLQPVRVSVKFYAGTEGHRIQHKYASISLAEFLGAGISGVFTRHDVSTSDEDSRRASLERTLKSSYAIRSEEVLQFVKEHEYLLSLLREAPQRIMRYFGSGDLALEMFKDPDDEKQRLVLLIRTNLTAKEARDKLDVLDEKWWLDASDKQDHEGNLSINVEFK